MGSTNSDSLRLEKTPDAGNPLDDPGRPLNVDKGWGDFDFKPPNVLVSAGSFF